MGATLKPPSQKTLEKYGLTAQEWLAILEQQGGVCAVCKKAPTTGRLCIDHEHVKGWKKMPPEKRKLFCRGLLCFFCNLHYVGRGITVQRSRNVTEYLLRYETEKLLRCHTESQSGASESALAPEPPLVRRPSVA